MNPASRTITLKVYDPDGNIRRDIVDTIYGSPADIADNATEFVYYLIRKSDHDIPLTFDEELPDSGEAEKFVQNRKEHKTEDNKRRIHV